MQTYYDRIYARAKPRNGETRLQRWLEPLSSNCIDKVASLVKPGQRMLDIGCGYGQLLQKCQEKFEELYGLDIAQEPVSWCHANLPAKFKVECSDGEKEGLQFDGLEFDTVTIVATIEHLVNPVSVIQSCYRILVPGGQLIVQTPNFAWLPRRISCVFGNPPQTSNEKEQDGGHLHYYTLRSLKELVTSCAFRVTKVDTCGVADKLRRPISVLGSDLLLVCSKKS